MLKLRNFLRVTLAFSALLSLAPWTTLDAQNAKLSSDLGKPAASGRVHVIIQYRNAPSVDDLNLITGLSGVVHHLYPSMNGLHASVPQSALGQLTKNPNIVYVSLDRLISAKQVSTTSAEYTYEPVNAVSVWQQGYQGTGVGVAVIDSGVNPVNDLTGSGNKNQSRIVYNQSFVPSAPGDAGDYYGHGTHVAGLIAGNGTQSTGSQYFRTFSGTAPNANIINLRVLDENGQGSDSSVIAAIDTAIQLQKQYNIRVINLSLGRPVFENYMLDPVCQAVEQAWNAGIVVVVAAGNDGRNNALNPEGYGTIEAPGNDPYALTVGAVKTMGTSTIQDDAVASYSSKGPTLLDHIVKPDILAPGNVVSSVKFANNDALATQTGAFVTEQAFYITGGGTTPSNDYFPLSGTSMATGVVAGAVADLISASNTLTPDQVKAFIMRGGNRTYLPATSTATDPLTGIIYIDHNDIFTIGAGYLDIANTLAMIQATDRPHMPTGTAMSPLAAYDPVTNSVFLLKEPGTLWGTLVGPPMPPAPPVPPAQSGRPAPPAPKAGPQQLTWNVSDVYGANAVGTQPASSSAAWGWTPLYGATNTTGQPVVAGLAGAASLWSATALPSPVDSSAFTALWGNGTPIWGTSTPIWGTGSPISSTGTPIWGTGTPIWGTTTPIWGTTTPIWGTGTPIWGTGTPIWGTSNPAATSALWGSSTSAASSTPEADSTPIWGTSVPYEN